MRATQPLYAGAWRPSLARAITRIRIILAGLLVGLVAAAFVGRAAEVVGASRPSLQELKPVVERAAHNSLTRLFSQVQLQIKGQVTNEIQEIGAAGWAPLNAADNEDVFWPVKTKTGVKLAGPGGETNLTIGLSFRVYRGRSGEWQAAYAGLFEHPDLELQSKRLVGMFCKTKGSGLVEYRDACVNNLRQLDGAKEQWALENRKTQADIPTFDDLIGMDKYIKVMPKCPDGGTYFLGPMSEKPRCTIEDHALP